MELTLISLIETTQPTILSFNENFVCLNGYVYKSQDGRIMQIHLACINGIWASAVQIFCQSSGSGSPISKYYSFKYSSCGEAIKSAWNYIKHYCVGSNGYINKKEEALFNKEYRKYMSMPISDYFKLFKEQGFYYWNQ